MRTERTYPPGGGPYGRDGVPAAGSRRRHLARRAYFLFALGCLVAGGAYVAEYRREQAWLSRKAREIVAGEVNRDRQVVVLRDYVRRHVRYEGAPLAGRPLLRASARESLESGLGYCGEATRAFIALARTLGIPAQRLYLWGPVNGHVVPEVEFAPGRWVLVDTQENVASNPLLDSGWRTADEVITSPTSPFKHYTNVNVQRIPLAGGFATRVKTEGSPVLWILENPSLIKALFWTGLGSLLLAFWATDRILARIYRRRLGAAGGVPETVRREEILASAPA